MESEQLYQVMVACKQQLLDTLKKLVMENGDDYNDYYRNEHGIEEEDGYTVVKVLDIASFGCDFALPLELTRGIEGDTDPTPEDLQEAFSYRAIQSLYIVRDDTGCETLMRYEFYNSGVNWQSDDAEPDHYPADEMGLAALEYLTEAIYWHLHCDVEKKQTNNRKLNN